MPRPVNSKRVSYIMRALKTKTAAQIAEELGISRQRVAQIIARNGGYPAQAVPKYQQHNGNRLLAARLAGRFSDTYVASRVNLSPSTILRLRVKLGRVHHRRVIPCPDCKSRHYARGLCKSCYMTALREGSLDNYPKASEKGKI